VELARGIKILKDSILNIKDTKERIAYTIMARPKKIHVDNNQPTWVCHKCGVKYGSFRAGIASWHQDTCGCCGRNTSVTEPRDYGYLLSGWQARREEELGENEHEDGSSRTV